MPFGQKSKTGPVVAVGLGLLIAVAPRVLAGAPSWPRSERVHAVAQHGAWLVIRQPGDGSCYAKQSYDADPDHLEITVRPGKPPLLIGPWHQGVEGLLTYQVDGGPTRTAPVRGIASFRLDPAVLPEMRAGGFLKVAVAPRGRAPWQQRFSLRGFTAASEQIASCE